MELDRVVVGGTTLVPELRYADEDLPLLDLELIAELLLPLFSVADLGRVYVERLLTELVLLSETFTGGRAKEEDDL